LRNDNSTLEKKKESELFLEVWRSLTKTEKEFVRLSCTDMTYVQIAQKLYLSPRTIEAHRVSIFNKFNAKTRVGLAVKVTIHLLSLLNNE
jgi:DNA-binding CsgD family transcriptional regulator